MTHFGHCHTMKVTIPFHPLMQKRQRGLFRGKINKIKKINVVSKYNVHFESERFGFYFGAI